MAVPSREFTEFMSRFTAQFETLNKGSTLHTGGRASFIIQPDTEYSFSLSVLYNHKLFSVKDFKQVSSHQS